ncbi:MAG: hypothetical protein EON95_11940, partial [Caulobacteraceae bacterium]
MTAGLGISSAMTDQPIDITHPLHNPFDAPKQKTSPVAWFVAIGFVLLIHGIIGYYLYTMRFTIKERIFEDEKLDTQL